MIIVSALLHTRIIQKETNILKQHYNEAFKELTIEIYHSTNPDLLFKQQLTIAWYRAVDVKLNVYIY